MVKLHSKIYSWCVILSSFEYFYISGFDNFGFGITLGKCLILLSFPYLLFKTIFYADIKYKDIRYSFLFFIPLIFSIGYSFFLVLQFNYTQKDILDKFSIINSIINLFFYYVYFVIFPIVIFKTKNDYFYFIKYFLYLGIFSLIFGFIDYICSSLSINLISRHINENVSVGIRFHSIYGEPRNAYVQLIALAAISSLLSVFRPVTRSKTLMLSIFIATLLTVSASMVVGIIISVVIGFIYLLFNFNLINKKIALISFVLIIFITIMSAYFERINDYVYAYSDIFSILTNHRKLSYLQSTQIVNFIPLYDILIAPDARISNLFFGNGLGSTKIVNAQYSGFDENLTPSHSGFVTIFYECGLFGILLILYLFFKFLKFEKIFNGQSIFFLFLMIGSFFSYKNYMFFFYIGLIVSLINYYQDDLV